MSPICRFTQEYRYCSSLLSSYKWVFLHKLFFTYAAAEQYKKLVEESGVVTHRFERHLDNVRNITDQGQDSTDVTNPSLHLAC